MSAVVQPVIAASTDEAIVKANDIARYFDVSPPWLNRVLEKKGRAILRAVDAVESFAMAFFCSLGLVTGVGQVIARYEVPVVAGQMLGLLVPPAEGLPTGDSLMISLPAGVGSAATVTIDNARREPVTVFAEQGLRFVKLGEVDPKQQATLPLPASMLGRTDAVRVFARPAGATERSTQALRVKEGDRLAVIVM